MAGGSPLSGGSSLRPCTFTVRLHQRALPEKVIDLAEVLSRYAGEASRLRGGFTNVQEAIREVAPPPMRSP